MHFPELYSDYPGMFRVGYLQRGMPYRRGEVDKPTLDRVKRLIEKPFNLTRGFHCCDLCKAGSDAIGNGEIQVKLDEGTVFIAPVLIAHYIEEHGYQPPDDFILALKSAK